MSPGVGKPKDKEWTLKKLLGRVCHRRNGGPSKALETIKNRRSGATSAEEKKMLGALIHQLRQTGISES